VLRVSPRLNRGLLSGGPSLVRPASSCATSRHKTPTLSGGRRRSDARLWTNGSFSRTGCTSKLRPHPAKRHQLCVEILRRMKMLVEKFFLLTSGNQKEDKRRHTSRENRTISNHCSPMKSPIMRTVRPKNVMRVLSKCVSRSKYVKLLMKCS